VERRRLRLTYETPDGLPLVQADADRLLQVLSNLLGNAIKFTPEGGQIAVRAESCGDEVQISVADTGPGIRPEDMEHLFDPFWQAERTASLGAGLGLSIVKGIVEAHGGRAWAASKLTVGTTLYVTIPVA
jgi:signal transduction histidine kinase